MFGNQDLKGVQKKRAVFFISSFSDIAKTYMVKADDYNDYNSTKTASVPRIYCFPLQIISSDFTKSWEIYSLKSVKQWEY